jgi:hypothetical protein
MSRLNYKACKKWDGVHTTLKTGFSDMLDANDWINDRIADGTLPPVESETREYYIVPDPLCPRCNKPLGAYPALSRRDNATDICSDCGTEEAFYDYAMSQRALIPVGLDVHTREALFARKRKLVNN